MKTELDNLLKREVKDNELELYALIGFVSIKFATIESRLSELLGTLIHPDEEFLTVTITKELFLNKTIELIKEVGLLRRSVNDKDIEEIVNLAKALKKERNDFVHGIWNVSIQDNGDIKAICSRRRITYKKDERGKWWSYGDEPKYITSNQLRKIAIQLEYLESKVVKLINRILDDPEFLL